MEALIRAAQKSGHAADIVTVISNRPDAQGLNIARTLGIEAISIDHRHYENREAFERELDLQCTGRSVELIACAGFMRILSDGFIRSWHGRMVNIHPSLLPCYRGLRTHERAFADGVRIHGCTVHFMTNDLDAGPIIAQAAVPVFAEDTPASLAERVLAQEHRLYPLTLDWLAAGRVRLEGGKVVYELDPMRDYGPFLVPATRG